MALPLVHTFSRNISQAAIQKGKYSNIRLAGIGGNMNPAFKWTTLAAAVTADTFFKVSAQCTAM
jgi:hypothetical protein